MTFGLFNVIVAIYVENAVAAAKFNDVRQKKNRLVDTSVFTDKAAELIETIWSNHESNPEQATIDSLPLEQVLAIQVTPALFERLLKMKHFQQILRDLDIADMDQVDLFEALDIDASGFLDLEQLVQGIAKLRGDARRSDVISVNLMVRAVLQRFTKFEINTSKELAAQAHLLKSLDETRSVDPVGASQRVAAE